jgi:crotonobetainyl-CoA:carnitine CoA-transferase CaiB-like acyl-CoA transferase
VIDDGRLRNDQRFATNPQRVENRRELVRLIGELLADKSKDDVAAQLTARGVPAAAIRSVDALLEDEQIEALQLIQKTGSGASLAVAPVRCDGQVPSLEARTPELGGSTSELLEECGYTHAEIAELLRERVAAASRPASAGE